MTVFSRPHNGRASSSTATLAPGDVLDVEVPTPLGVGPFALQGRRPSLAALEAFRILALTIDRLSEESPTRSIAFLSAGPGEGRSLSAELLALAMSERHAPVRLLDADPFQHALGPQSRQLGLRSRFKGTRRDEFTALRQRPDEEHAEDDIPALARIPVARDSFPSHAAFLEEVRLNVDTEVAMGARVLVDVPACSVSSIGFSVAQFVDAVIYVVRRDRASVDAHREVLTQAALLDLNVIGMLLNEG